MNTSTSSLIALLPSMISFPSSVNLWLMDSQLLNEGLNQLLFRNLPMGQVFLLTWSVDRRLKPTLNKIGNSLKYYNFDGLYEYSLPYGTILVGNGNLF